MKITRTDPTTSSSQHKKPRNAHRLYDFVDLIKKVEDELVTEETEHYLRRYKKEKDGTLTLLYELKKEAVKHQDYADSLLQKLNHSKIIKK